jgi:PAS domain-containing protein
MIQGLVVYDASARIVTFNRRYIEMFNLSPDIVKPGSHFHDVIQHRKDRGSFSGDVKEFCSAFLQNIAQGEVDRGIMQCADGRWIQAVCKSLAHGGWVATLEDITERRNLEQERDRSSTFLREIIDHIPSQITVKMRMVAAISRQQRTEAQFGISRDDIVGKTAFEIFPRHPPRSSPPMTTGRCSPQTGSSRTSTFGRARRRACASSPRDASASATRRASRATSSTSSKTLPSAAAPTRRSRTSRITTR